jgi:hypothetical protein
VINDDILVPRNRRIEVNVGDSASGRRRANGGSVQNTVDVDVIDVLRATLEFLRPVKPRNVLADAHTKPSKGERESIY